MVYNCTACIYMCNRVLILGRMETQCGFDAQAYMHEWDAPVELIEDSQPPFQREASDPLETNLEPEAPPKPAEPSCVKATEEAVTNQPETVPEAPPKLAKSMTNVKATEESLSSQPAVEPENPEALDPKPTEEARSDPSTAKRAVEIETAPEATPKKSGHVEPELAEVAPAKPTVEHETSPKALPDPPLTKLPALSRGTPLALSESLQSKASMYQEAKQGSIHHVQS